MKRFFQQFVDWNKQQRITIIILFSLVLLSAAIPYTFKSPENLVFEDTVLEKQLNRIVPNEKKTIDSSSLQSTTTQERQLQNFNPNESSLHTWLQLGVPQKIAQRILNYLDHKGHFYRKEDLKKIYGFPEHLYLELEPYIQIASPQQNKNTPQAKTPVRTIDINTSEQKDWESLKGIGEKTALRILKYKNLLGGFYDVQQIREVYGINDTLFLAIKNQLHVTHPTLHKININTATFIDLGKHPYIGFAMAKKITAYREKKSPFKSLDELIPLGIVEANQIERLRFYLVVE